MKKDYYFFDYDIDKNELTEVSYVPQGKEFSLCFRDGTSLEKIRIEFGLTDVQKIESKLDNYYISTLVAKMIRLVRLNSDCMKLWPNKTTVAAYLVDNITHQLAIPKNTRHFVVYHS